MRYYHIIYILLLIWTFPLSAAEIPIFYPDIKDPYLSIFKDAIRGIDSTIGQPVQTRLITNDVSSVQLQSWANQLQAPLAIAMGPSSLKTLQDLKDDASILAAIFITEPSNLNKVAVAVTYAPDPMILFKTMQRLDKRTNRVHVVINPLRWQWLIDFAAQAAQRLNMELVVHNARNVSESAKLYDKVLKDMNSISDSLWLPEDSSTMDAQVILPMVLSVMWDKNLKIFSSGVSQVGRGALFGLYPDSYAMGEYVGQVAQKLLKNQKIEEPVQPLRQLKSAINIKSMQHIGLQIDQETLNSFTVVLPKDAR